MPSQSGSFVVVSLLFFSALPGCDGQRGEWEMILQNQGNIPVSAVVTFGADNAASVKDVPATWNQQITSGKGSTIVNTIKILRGKEETMLKVNETLHGGHQFLIVVNEHGGTSTKIHKR